MNNVLLVKELVEKKPNQFDIFYNTQSLLLVWETGAGPWNCAWKFWRALFKSHSCPSCDMSILLPRAKSSNQIWPQESSVNDTLLWLIFDQICGISAKRHRFWIDVYNFVVCWWILPFLRLLSSINVLCSTLIPLHPYLMPSGSYSKGSMVIVSIMLSTLLNTLILWYLAAL